MGIGNFKPLNFCVNVSVPSVNDGSLSLYDVVCNLANQLEEMTDAVNGAISAIADFRKLLAPLENGYVTSVQNATGDVLYCVEAETPSLNSLPANQDEMKELYESGCRLGLAYSQDEEYSCICVLGFDKSGAYKWYPIVDYKDYLRG